jgi:hypothetical protein
MTQLRNSPPQALTATLGAHALMWRIPPDNVRCARKV